jgi:hypothetical protein
MTICNFSRLKQLLFDKIMALLNDHIISESSLVDKINKIPRALNTVISSINALNSIVICKHIIQNYNSRLSSNIQAVQYNYNPRDADTSNSMHIVNISNAIKSNMTNILHDVSQQDHAKMKQNSVFIYRLYGAYLYILYVIYYIYSYFNFLVLNSAAVFNADVFIKDGINSYFKIFGSGIIDNLNIYTLSHKNSMNNAYDSAFRYFTKLRQMYEPYSLLHGVINLLYGLLWDYAGTYLVCKYVGAAADAEDADTYKQLIITDREYIRKLPQPAEAPLHPERPPLHPALPLLAQPPPSVPPSVPPSAPPSAPAHPQPQHQPPSMMHPLSHLPQLLSRGQPQASVPKPPSVLLPAQPIYTPSISDIFTICANESDDTKKRTVIRNYLATPIELPTLGAHPVRDAAAPADAANPSTWLFP